jgi:N6-adenosine-specific RNA methylase IME4
MTTTLPVFVGHTWDEHVNAWKSITKEIEDRQWALGAIADSLTRHYSESSVERFAGDVRCKPSTVWQYAHVYQRFRNYERSENLSWSHHLIASYSDDPKAALIEAEDKKLSVGGLRLIVRGEQDRKALKAPDLVAELRRVGKFRAILFKAILIDPPWPYSDQGSRVSTSRHYETLTIETLLSLPVGELAASGGCHLYLWVTNSFMRDAFRLLDAWGFTEKTIITWVKESGAGKVNFGFGHYFRNATEHMIFAVRGNMPTLCNDQPNVLFSGRARHSQKPESAYRLVERMSPPPYLELFGRKRLRNWTVWGNEEGENLYSC